jgi:DNA mismatch endonuclease (patch repair protein)
MRRPAAIDVATAERLGRIRQSDTLPEQRVRAALRLRGLYYRCANRDLPGSPDIANRKGHWAVFVHGCFWHHHKGCRRATIPKNNRAFWLAKFAANRHRDARVCKALEDLGYTVVVFWECETKSSRALRSCTATLLRASRRG